MAAVQSFCSKAILLKGGQCYRQGLTEAIIQDYLKDARADSEPKDWLNHPGRRQGSVPIIEYAEVLGSAGKASARLAVGERLTFRICLRASSFAKRLGLGIGINDSFGTRIAGFDTQMHGVRLPDADQHLVVECTPEGLCLAPGAYRVKLVLKVAGHDTDTLDDALDFTVEPSDYFGTGVLPHASQGSALFRADWLILEGAQRGLRGRANSKLPVA
jgi:hypothetical protein